MQRHHAASPAASTLGGRLEYCIAAAPSATGIGCARIVCTQPFSEEAHYSRSRARKLFPGFGSPKPGLSELPNPASGSPNSGVGKCQKSGFGKPPFSAREWGVAWTVGPLMP